MDRATFFLGAFDETHARAAFSRPAGLYGLGFTTDADESPSCLGALLELVIDRGPADDGSGAEDAERRRYQPALVSLVGAHLWKVLELDADAPSDPARVLTRAELLALIPDLSGVFHAYLNEALALVVDQGAVPGVDRYDVLELIDRLGTSSEYRNIVAQEELIAQSPLPAPVAALLLDLLDRDLHLIRRYPERGRLVVEITHEQLIRPAREMLSALRLQNFKRASLAVALEMLRMMPDEPDAARADPLPGPFRDALVEYLPRLDLGLVERKTLLRSLLFAGPEGGGGARWSEAVIAMGSGAAQSVSGRSPRPLLSGEEMDVLLQRDALEAVADEPQFLVRSALADRSEGAGPRIDSMLAAVTPSAAQGGRP
jgi:hypothetical protein